MDFSPNSKLTPLQRELLVAFFEREQRFFLTGGAALAGFHFGHRPTEDLDLFATPGPNLEDAGRVLAEASRACGAEIEAGKTYPEFRRALVRRGDELCIVDLVIERAKQIDTVKPMRGVVRIDTLREIAANKLCTLLGRAEIKDLVDLRELIAHGMDLEQGLADAARKDAGVDPATLAWLLGELKIASEATLPGGVDPHALDTFRRELVERLQKMAFEMASRS